MRCSHRWRSVLALVVLGPVLAACGGPAPATSGRPAGSDAAHSPAGVSPSSPAATGRPVHVRLYEKDGSTYGVGMPIIAYVSATITDAKEFTTATRVTVNGSPAQGAWYFEKSSIYSGYPLEAHYRPA